ncbi:hypothetical protein KY285_007837 [Solanum tuberosum]|nr:hypothetical protein KY285_007837 [Solanum tuberosum]
MMKTRFMTSQKPSSPSSSFEVDILSLSSNSSIGSMASPFVSSKKRASSSKQKASKKPLPLASGSLSPADMQRFWGLEQKHRYDNFKSLPIVPGRVVNLSQLKDSHCPYISAYCSHHSHSRKGLLSNISTRDVFILYCLLWKYRINWAIWFREYMWESVEDINASASLPYEKVFRLQKDTTTDVGKLLIAMTGIKQEGISTVNKFTHQVDSLKGGVSFSNNDFAVSVQIYYSSLSRGMERSYNTFYGKVINTLKYFLGDR